MKTASFLRKSPLFLVAFPRETPAKKRWTTSGKRSEGYLESLEAHDEPIPPPISEEIVEVAVGATPLEYPAGTP
jgi:hypothetical protein